ncbi:MAG: polyprenyl diphosphate synthase [Christensenellales bacterium]
MKSDEIKTQPLHVAMIMDGNGRWAQKRLLPRSFGHREGVKTLIRLVTHAFDTGFKYVTVYAFSTENRLRPKEEVDGLIDLIRKNFATTFRRFIDRGIKIRILGDRKFFPSDVAQILSDAESDSKDGKNGTFNVALNYGGRAEIVRAVNEAVKRGEEVSEESIGKLLYTYGQPDPDMLIRTGGEKRLSNFLLYQTAYTELFFTDTLWPDFSDEEFDSVVDEFRHRNRRYGKVK